MGYPIYGSEQEAAYEEYADEPQHEGRVEPPVRREVEGHDPAGLSDDPDPTELAQSAAVEQPISPERTAVPPAVQAPSSQGSPGPSVPAAPHSSTELIEAQQGRTADAPLCLTCGTKMRPAGSCYVCEGCGSTSGCS